MKRIAAAAKNHSVACHQTQGSGVGRHVGATLENHTNHPERTANSLDLQSVRAIPLADDLANGIRQLGNRQQAVSNSVDAFAVQLQPIEHCLGKPR